jgi:hypothetical protein
MCFITSKRVEYGSGICKGLLKKTPSSLPEAYANLYTVVPKALSVQLLLFWREGWNTGFGSKNQGLIYGHRKVVSNLDFPLAILVLQLYKDCS